MTPDDVLPVDPEFAALYADVTCEGALIAAKSRIGFVGLARDCADVLGNNLKRIEETGKHFAGWKAFVFENDSIDGTKEILTDWAQANPENVSVELLDNGRQRLRGFERERVLALASYRERCQEYVRDLMPDLDYVAVVDLDARGGWSLHGIINGIGWHAYNQELGCLGSVSLFQHEKTLVDGRVVFCHYDNWAYRWIGWTPRLGPWFTLWTPPVGAAPIPVNSVFGGLAIYKLAAFLQGQYGKDGDCEHVGFHRTMKEKGWQIAINPAQRCLMSWVDEETATNGRQHGDDQH